MNIFDFDNDLYGKEVTVQFHQRIRGDQKFKNVTNLKQAIALDKNAVKSWFRKQSERVSSVFNVNTKMLHGPEMYCWRVESKKQDQNARSVLFERF